MKTWITILAGVLVLQIAVAVGVNMGQNDYRAFESAGKLLSFDMQTVDRIRIDGDAGTNVVLDKQDDQWRLPALNDFPADQDNVKRLLAAGKTRQRVAGGHHQGRGQTLQGYRGVV